MKKVILIFLFIFILVLPSRAENVRFIQITDVHLKQNNQENLKDFVREVNSTYKNIDFVVFTGDNIDRANKKDFKTFLGIIKGLKIKTYVIAGNHDVFRINGLDKKLYMNALRHNLGRHQPNKTNFVFKEKDVVFICMDGVKETIPGPCGYFKAQELLWLNKKLNRYKNKNVVIFQHFPLIEANNKDHETYRKDEYLKLLDEHKNVVAVISGHFHENRREKINGVYHIVTNSFQNNNSYRIIDVNSKNKILKTYSIEKGSLGEE